MIQIELYSYGIKTMKKCKGVKKNPCEVIEGVLQDHDIKRFNIQT